MHYFLIFLLIAIPFAVQSNEETVVNAVRTHLIIGDYPTACHLAWQELQQNPDSKLIWISYLSALCHAGEEKTAIETFRQFLLRFPEEINNREVLEEISWCVIDNSYKSASPIIRVTAVLGGFFSQDAKGVALLRCSLRDPNSQVRAIAVKLAAHLKDSSLQDEIMCVLLKDPVWKVRVEAVRAVGQMQMVEAKPRLLELIANEKIHDSEKAAAIEAVIQMVDHVEPQQLVQLVSSDRAGFRLLACEFIAHYQLTDQADLLAPLTRDYHASVRASALQTLGLLRVKTLGGIGIAEIAAQASRDPDHRVSITGAWLLALNDPVTNVSSSTWHPSSQQLSGQQTLKAFLSHPDRDTRHLAAAAVSALGRYGQPLLLREFQNTQDPYVKMNLAIGLIGQRADTQAACHSLFNALSNLKEYWMWKEEGIFRYIAPSDLTHDEEIPNYPDAVNQLTRLEVLEILSILQYPQAQQAIKAFLKERRWGLTGMASALLLTEGDDAAVELVRGLLKDPDKEVRIQAALILALWGSEEAVLKQLEEAYVTADRDLKGQILEGIGRIGSESSISFLAERLQDPFPTLRIIAAAAMLECLYH